jgi:hypothetical protein
MNEEEREPNLSRLVLEHPALFRGSEPDVPSYVSPGWNELIGKLCTDLEHAAGADVGMLRVRQIKEKFGVLRLYWQLDEEGDVAIDAISPRGAQAVAAVFDEPDAVLRQRIRGLVDAAESKSTETCETCGRPGRLASDGGWWRTRCPIHTKGDE